MTGIGLTSPGGQQRDVPFVGYYLLVKYNNEKHQRDYRMRGPRERSESGVYHIVLRGINRQDIFHDYQRFIETVQQM